MSTYDVESYAGEDVGDGMYHHAPRPRSAESLTASSVPPTPSAPIPMAQSDLLTDTDPEFVPALSEEDGFL